VEGKGFEENAAGGIYNISDLMENTGWGGAKQDTSAAREEVLKLGKRR
jgi:hypothetical protein